MKLLSVREAAEELHLSEQLVYGLCQHRKIRHERHGLGRGKILIPEDAIAAYRQSVTVEIREGAKPPPPRPRFKPLHLRLKPS
jgi:excisionase family DNA binding protein